MATILPTQSNETALQIDETGTTTYIGRAKIGTAGSVAAWQIRRIVSSGTIDSFQYANGSRRYNQIWDNRSSLTYS